MLASGVRKLQTKNGWHEPCRARSPERRPSSTFQQSAFAPGGQGAAQILSLTWVLTGLALLVFVCITGYLLVALFRRRRSEEPRHVNDGLVIGLFGAVIPAVILLVVFGFTVHTMVALASPGGSAAATVEVTGHQWWWEVRYP